MVTFPAVILHTAGWYVWQATGSNVTPGQTGTINVVLPTLVPQSTSSATVTAGVSFSVTFLVETAQGTPDSYYAGAVMLSVFMGPASYLPISGAGPEVPSNGSCDLPGGDPRYGRLVCLAGDRQQCGFGPDRHDHRGGRC